MTWVYTAPVRIVAVTLGAIGEVAASEGVNQNGRLATIRVYVEDVLGLVQRTVVGWRTGQFSCLGYEKTMGG